MMKNISDLVIAIILICIIGFSFNVGYEFGYKKGYEFKTKSASYNLHDYAFETGDSITQNEFSENDNSSGTDKIKLLRHRR